MSFHFTRCTCNLAPSQILITGKAATTTWRTGTEVWGAADGVAFRHSRINEEVAPPTIHGHRRRGRDLRYIGLISQNPNRNLVFCLETIALVFRRLVGLFSKPPTVNKTLRYVKKFTRKVCVGCYHNTVVTIVYKRGSLHLMKLLESSVL